MNEKMFSLEIVTPHEVVFDGKVNYVEAPSSVGNLGILPSHTPLLATLKKGKIKVKHYEKEIVYNSSDGFIEILPDKVRILIESVER